MAFWDNSSVISFLQILTTFRVCLPEQHIAVAWGHRFRSDTATVQSQLYLLCVLEQVLNHSILYRWLDNRKPLKGFNDSFATMK